ncbi:hypothetical protein ACIQGZ_14615 [Streptomyces sp. NPDC092296]|uniref:hypothetical protein n=1 Tax=Streptomyces sp. NPDC092296 TaxID=3366012 RepID=UPI00382B2052
MREAEVRGSYALARVTVVRAAVARSLLWIGVVGAAAGVLLPSLVPRVPAALVGAGLFVVGVVYGVVHRRGWWHSRAAAAQRAGFTVTVEPARLTRRRQVRDCGLLHLAGLLVLAGSGFAAGPAAGLGVAGLGVGLLLSVRRLVRWERAHEVLLWARTDDGWLLGRRGATGAWSSTGPAAGRVRPVVHPVRVGRR